MSKDYECLNCGKLDFNCKCDNEEQELVETTIEDYYSDRMRI